MQETKRRVCMQAATPYHSRRLVGAACDDYSRVCVLHVFFFFQAEDGIRDLTVTGVQTCALPILTLAPRAAHPLAFGDELAGGPHFRPVARVEGTVHDGDGGRIAPSPFGERRQIGRASCRERV